MTRKNSDLYLELAELVRANVSGPVRQKIVASAQKRLVQKLEDNGVLSKEEADGLSY